MIQYRICWALSSAGRAFGLHPKGREFDPLSAHQKKEVSFLSQIVVDEGENLEKAIKRFKRLVEKEGIIREWKKREFFEKPSTIRNRKNKAMQRKLLKKNRKSHDSKAGY